MSNLKQIIYLISNRNLLTSRNKEIGFGTGFNEKAPDELRLAKVTGTPKQWAMDILPESKSQTGNNPSKKLFFELVKTMRKHHRSCLFFVHGFNNAIKDVVERCMVFQNQYDVEVIAFSWPADEGLRGALSYRAQKHEARLSVNALDRCLEKLNNYLCKYLIDHENQTCDLTFNIALHSMGNYLLKNLMNSSVYEGETLIFDNVILLAADTNNEDHAQWVDRIAHRKRIYITLNENDRALAVARVKFGKLQKARLGHYIKNLQSAHAVYLDFTHAKGVDSSHTYFEGELLGENPAIKGIFYKLFNGQVVERGMPYDPHSRCYRVE